MSEQPRRGDGTPQGRVFGEVAETYDRVRPGYPDELFSLLERSAGLQAGAQVLEVGAGTGKATSALVERGWEVTVVEPDAAMAHVLRGRVPEATVVVSPFEEVDLAGPYDLVCAAQSWHWVDGERAFPKAARLLRNGGSLAMWWNLPDGTSGTVSAALDAVYAEHAPQMEHGHWHGEGYGLPDEPEAPVWPGFGGVTVDGVVWDTTYDADQYVSLLETQSDHRMLDGDVRDRLLPTVHDVVERHGGISIRYVCRLHLARRL